jgi:putative ABC transport system permease protein
MSMRALLSTFSWQELRHHPWRNAAAVVAVMLGVALAFSVALINASALSEFSSAVRSVDGQPDLALHAAQGSFDDALFARVAHAPQVSVASPVLELATYALSGAGPSQGASGPMGDNKPPAVGERGGNVAADGKRMPLRVLGIDALVVASVAPALLPLPQAGADRLAVLAPATVFLNPAARQALQTATGALPATLQLQSGLALHTVRIAGTIKAGGAPLAVMDIAAAQELFGKIGQLTRIDVRLRAGVDRAAFIRSLQRPPGIGASEPGDAGRRTDNLSRAYRVNLTVLALVALFTGAFLVYSVLSLSVAKRARQIALLGVLGLTGR